MQQTPAHILMLGAALPALIAGAAALLGWGLLCDDQTPAARRPSWIAPPALFLAFLGVLGATNALEPSLWPVNAPDRKLAIGLVALGAGLIDALAPWRIARVATLALAGAGASWITAGALHPHALGTSEFVALLSIAGVLAASSHWVFERWEGDASLAALALGLTCAGAAAVLFMGGSPKTGLQAGLLGSFFGAWGLAAVVIPRASVARGGAAMFVVVLVGLLTAGQAFSFEPAPRPAYMLVPVAAAGAGLSARRVRGRHWLVRTLVVFLATAAPLGAAVGLALAAPAGQDEEEDEDSGGWGWPEPGVDAP